MKTLILGKTTWKQQKDGLFECDLIVRQGLIKQLFASEEELLLMGAVEVTEQQKRQCLCPCHFSWASVGAGHNDDDCFCHKQPEKEIEQPRFRPGDTTPEIMTWIENSTELINSLSSRVKKLEEQSHIYQYKSPHDKERENWQRGKH